MGWSLGLIQHPCATEPHMRFARFGVDDPPRTGLGAGPELGFHPYPRSRQREALVAAVAVVDDLGGPCHLGATDLHFKWSIVHVCHVCNTLE